MVGAGELHRCGKAFHAHFLQARFGDVERLEALPDFFLRRIFLTRNALRIAHRFRHQHRVVNTAIVKVVGEFRRIDLRQPLVDNMLLDVLDHREIGTGLVEVQRLVALGLVFTAARIIIAAGPPHAHQLVHREIVAGASFTAVGFIAPQP